MKQVLNIPSSLILSVLLLLHQPEAHAGSGGFSQAELVEKYAPVLVQQIGRQPIYDLITRFDFDGNQSGLDNVDNAGEFPIPANVYGGVIAETTDAYFIFYGLYHIKDYDTPLREFLFDSAAHDNDFEGAMLAVSKASGGILAIETWFHNLFAQCGHAPLSAGSQSIDAKIHVENGTHPILYVDSSGHGVRCFQKGDEQTVAAGAHLIYRPGQIPTGDLRAHHGSFAHYSIRDVNELILSAKGPFEAGSMFAEPASFGLGEEPLGQFFSGSYRGQSNWARPKPPWSWADKRDEFRPGAWFFHPAYVFNRHYGLNLSYRYLSNRPVDALYPVSSESLDQWAQGSWSNSWFSGRPRNLFERKLNQAKHRLNRLIEYFFYHLG